MSDWNNQVPGEPVTPRPAEGFTPPVPPAQRFAQMPQQPRVYQPATSEVTATPVPTWQAPVAQTLPAPLPPRVVVKHGPGWGALIISMFLTAVLTAVAVAATGVMGTRFTTSSHRESSLLEPQTTGPLAEVVDTTAEAADWEAVANAVRPATVSLSVTTKSGGSTGSGVIWDNQGHIVTNHHVIDGADGEDAITVVLSDGRLFKANVVGSDKSTDLAVIKLKTPPKDLVSGNFGTSANLRIGQAVMAVGSPLGLSDTVTTGIISALNRPVAVAGANPETPGLGEDKTDKKAVAEPIITNAIQVDASINPGNSGGPLFDATGRVIGINSSIASNRSAGEQAGSIGLGFAIPVDLVRNVVTQIIETGNVAHAQLGVSISNGVGVTSAESRFGAEIQQIVPGSAAEKAGLKVGDVITFIDGNQVNSGRALTGYVRRYRPGDEAVLQLVRAGKTIELKITLGKK